MRAFLRESFITPVTGASDGRLKVDASVSLTFYEIDGTTPWPYPIYAARTGSTLATLATNGNGEFLGYSNVEGDVIISGGERTVLSRFIGDDKVITVTDFGAAGDGVTDDTAAIQAAIDYAESLTYARLYFPAGLYLNTGLTSRKRIHWYGDGYDRSVLILKNTVSTTQDHVTVIAGTSGIDLGGGCIQDLGITPQSTSAGRHALVLDGSTSGSNFFRFRVVRCDLYASTSVAAARAVKTIASSPAGSTWLSEVELDANRVTGGFQFNDVADQVWITRNLIAGPNVAIEANCKVPGASKWVIRENTAVTAQAIWFKTYANDLSIENNYWETIAAWPVFAAGQGWSGTQAIIHLDGTTAGDIKSTIIRGNQISLLTGHTGVGIKAHNTSVLKIHENQIYPADGGTYGIEVDSTCTGTKIGPGQQTDGSGTLVHNLGETDLEVDTDWTAFTPTVDQAGAVTVTVNRARYIIRGKRATVQMNLSVTGSGTGGNAFAVAVPAAIKTAAVGDVLGTVLLLDLSAGVLYHGSVIATITTGFNFCVSGATNVMGAAGGGFTAGLAAGDTIRMQLEYEVDPT